MKRRPKCRPSLRADYESGEGSAVIPDSWLAGRPLMRVDILQDWIADLEQQRDAALVQFEGEMKSLPRTKHRSAWVT